MAVIKSNNAATVLKEAIVLDLGDLSNQAARLKKAAEAKAEQIVRDAELQAEQFVRDAGERGFEDGKTRGEQRGYEDGLERGVAEAREQAAEQINIALGAWRQATGEIEAMRARIEREAKQAVLEVALRMAEKLVHRVVEIDETVIIDQVATALSHVLRPVDVSVRVNPEDRAIVDEAMPELLADFAHFRHIQLVDDPQLQRGGCVVNYGQGRVDASIDKQLQRVVEAMLPGGIEIADSHIEDAADPAPLETNETGEAGAALNEASPLPDEGLIHDSEVSEDQAEG